MPRKRACSETRGRSAAHTSTLGRRARGRKANEGDSDSDNAASHDAVSFLRSNAAVLGFEPEMLLYQCTRELVENAMDARARVVHVHISAASHTDDLPADEESPSSASGRAEPPRPRTPGEAREVLLVVTDDGTGMSGPDLSRLATSVFATSKPRGESESETHDYVDVAALAARAGARKGTPRAPNPHYAGGRLGVRAKKDGRASGSVCKRSSKQPAFGAQCRSSSAAGDAQDDEHAAMGRYGVGLKAVAVHASMSFRGTRRKSSMALEHCWPTTIMTTTAGERHFNCMQLALRGDDIDSVSLAPTAKPNVSAQGTEVRVLLHAVIAKSLAYIASYFSRLALLPSTTRVILEVADHLIPGEPREPDPSGESQAVGGDIESTDMVPHEKVAAESTPQVDECGAFVIATATVQDYEQLSTRKTGYCNGLPPPTHQNQSEEHASNENLMLCALAHQLDVPAECVSAGTVRLRSPDQPDDDPTCTFVRVFVAVRPLLASQSQRWDAAVDLDFAGADFLDDDHGASQVRLQQQAQAPVALRPPGHAVRDGADDVPSEGSVDPMDEEFPERGDSAGVGSSRIAPELAQLLGDEPGPTILAKASVSEAEHGDGERMLPPRVTGHALDGYPEAENGPWDLTRQRWARDVGHRTRHASALAHVIRRVNGIPILRNFTACASHTALLQHVDWNSIGLKLSNPKWRSRLPRDAADAIRRNAPWRLPQPCVLDAERDEALTITSAAEEHPYIGISALWVVIDVIDGNLQMPFASLSKTHWHDSEAAVAAIAAGTNEALRTLAERMPALLPSTFEMHKQALANTYIPTIVGNLAAIVADVVSDGDSDGSEPVGAALHALLAVLEDPPLPGSLGVAGEVAVAADPSPAPPLPLHERVEKALTKALLLAAERGYGEPISADVFDGDLFAQMLGAAQPQCSVYATETAAREAGEG